MNDKDPPDGVVACREYEVPLAEGGTARMAFTLVRRDLESVACDLARALRARAYGFISIVDYPAAPRHPVVWMQLPTQLALTVAEGDEDVGDDLKRIIARHLIQFIGDIASIAPELAFFCLKRAGGSPIVR